MMRMHPRNHRPEEIHEARGLSGNASFHWPPLKLICVVSRVGAAARRASREEITALSRGVKLDSMAAMMPASCDELELRGIPLARMKPSTSDLVGSRFCVIDLPVESA